jgi:hypothetical protein
MCSSRNHQSTIATAKRDVIDCSCFLLPINQCRPDETVPSLAVGKRKGSRVVCLFLDSRPRRRRFGDGGRQARYVAVIPLAAHVHPVSSVIG